MEQIEIQTTAIETNVRTLIKTHPDSKRFMETLRNEAIDQAFREMSEQLHYQNNRIFILEQQVTFLEKRTHHLAPKMERLTPKIEE